MEKSHTLLRFWLKKFEDFINSVRFVYICKCLCRFNPPVEGECFFQVVCANAFYQGNPLCQCFGIPLVIPIGNDLSAFFDKCFYFRIRHADNDDFVVGDVFSFYCLCKAYFIKGMTIQISIIHAADQDFIFFCLLCYMRRINLRRSRHEYSFTYGNVGIIKGYAPGAYLCPCCSVCFIENAEIKGCP